MIGLGVVFTKTSLIDPLPLEARFVIPTILALVQLKITPDVEDVGVYEKVVLEQIGALINGLLNPANGLTVTFNVCVLLQPLIVSVT